MLKIRRAIAQDKKEILKILKEIDLFYEGQSGDSFWLAKTDEKIIGFVQFKEYSEFYFLSSLAILPEHRNNGVAAALIEEVLKTTTKDTYIYTIIPKFFEKFGFSITNPISSLPSKNKYECEYCQPKKCVCMVRKYNAA